LNRLLSSLSALVFIATLGMGISDAKSCRDAHGKFIKCPAAHMMAAHKPCRDKHGKFVKCPK
jgi:hypothetical protein